MTILRRRDFITLLGGGAAAWPLEARAQQVAMPVVGYLSGNVAGGVFAATYLPAFRQGLKDIGYIERQNVAIEYRWAGGQYDRLPALAADLVGGRVSVISATDNAAAQAPQPATSSLPSVFSLAAAPV